MNPVNPSKKCSQKPHETSASQNSFQKVFDKHSAFTEWADSSSEDDLYEDEKMQTTVSAQSNEGCESKKKSILPVSANELYEVAEYDEGWSENDHPFNDFASENATMVER